MKFSSLLSLAAPALAGTNGVKLIVESTDSRFAGRGLTNIHFGAGINGVLIGNESPRYQYNDEKDFIYLEVQDIPMTLTSFSDALVFMNGEGNSDSPMVQYGYLTRDDSSSGFYACKTLKYDPYGYTKNPDTFGVSYYSGSAPDDCISIKVAVQAYLD